MWTGAQLAGAGFLALFAAAGAVCSDPSTMTCSQVTSAVTVDADLSEWAGVAGITTPIRTQDGVDYAMGQAIYKCSHNTTHINFALQVPGTYRFDTVTSHKCGVTSLMFKVGADATYLNMGGCPDPKAQNASLCGALMESGKCASHTVDLMARVGGKTQPLRGNAYSGPSSGALQDKYTVSSYCQTYDNGAGAGNEWVGAWDHSDPRDRAIGNYTFELTRSLTTTSAGTDVQLALNRVYKFGISYWDPMETSEGWTDPGHYLTGCGLDWINLVVGNEMLSTDNHNHAASGVRGRSVRAGLLLAILGAVTMMSQ